MNVKLNNSDKSLNLTHKKHLFAVSIHMFWFHALELYSPNSNKVNPRSETSATHSKTYPYFSLCNGTVNQKLVFVCLVSCFFLFYAFFSPSMSSKRKRNMKVPFIRQRNWNDKPIWLQKERLRRVIQGPGTIGTGDMHSLFCVVALDFVCIRTI